jgi:5-methylcytosine-specific restriction endonuclease McrA
VSGKKVDRERRTKMWARDPRCHWCGIVTIEPPPGDKRKHFADNEATIDHLRPRGDPTRRIPPRNGERRLVVACRKCNNERDRNQWPKEKRRAMTLQGKRRPPRLARLVDTSSPT